MLSCWFRDACYIPFFIFIRIPFVFRFILNLLNLFRLQILSFLLQIWLFKSLSKRLLPSGYARAKG